MKEITYEYEVCPIAGCIGDCDCELEKLVTEAEAQWEVKVSVELRE